MLPPDLLHPWHDFYLLTGTAAATLVGLMFVAASISAGTFSRDKRSAMRSFLSPTVVHFGFVLAACLIGVAPIGQWPAGSALFIVGGLTGLLYAVHVWRGMVRQGLNATIDLDDRVFHALLPAASYLLMLGSGAALAFGVPAGCDLLALAMALLLAAGIRNAWDMTLWIIERRAG